ncbi:MAG: tetratricopeptide repeat protein, partial [candidate division Zixibacteria bacterium]|nr:tetratricopeptide repeat protein [candidate division Zixibacteria bacterium]
ESSFAGEARLRLGKLQFDRAAHAEAIRTLEPLTTASLPVRAEALYISALCNRALADPTRTEVELRRLIDDYPGSPLAVQGRLRLAELALERHNYNIAQTQVNTILAERTDELAAEAQFLAGEILYAQERWSDAEVQYLKVKYVYPAFIRWIAKALLRAGEANIHLENYEKARSLLQSVLDDYPDSPVIDQVRTALERIPR